MNFSFIKTAIVALCAQLFFAGTTSVYSFKVANINGQDSIDLNTFRGKAILIVNTATSSPYSLQMASLDSLYLQHADSLVVIACPSNSFGNESESNSDIARLTAQRFGIHFLMAQKTAVKGDDIGPLYHWLISKDLNGVMNSKIKNDFYKYLIDRNGNLKGVFNETVLPTGQQISAALNNNL